jgi:glucose-fructose oxidoreductase
MNMLNRRKFIRHSAASIAGLTVSQLAFSNIIIPQKKDKLGVALVGLGYYSTDLLAPGLQLTQHCKLAGIVTGTPEKATKWKQQYNIPDKNIYNYQNFDTIANNPDIDVVYVVLPPSMHAEYSIRASKAGKHVWCEKPMAMTEAECKSMIDAAKNNKLTLAIGYRLHHEPNTQEIIRIRKDNAYGKVVSTAAAAGYRDDRTNHWKQIKKLGGGAMYDMGVYSLNAARYATGLEPIAVFAKASTTRPEIYKEVEETMNYDLEFPEGVTAKCETTFGRGINTLETKFVNGWYKLEPFQGYSGQRGITSDGKILNAVIPHQQAKQMDDDALAIMNKKPMLVPGEEGLKDIRVVEAIYKSVALGKQVKIG